MKNLLFSFCTLALLAIMTSTSYAQSDKPAPSPASTVTQMVGLTKITIDYSRPSVKDRKIFAEDGLVPFGKTWRTGANQPNKFTFSTDVTIGGKKLPAGSYTLTTVPGADEWKVELFNHESANAADKKAAASFTVKPMDMGDLKVETFLIDINDIRDTSATLNLIWANTAVIIPIEVPKTW